MGRGRRESPETAEASPNRAVHHGQAAHLCQQPLVDSSDSRPEPRGRVAGRLCAASGRRALPAGDCRLQTEPMESPARNIHPPFGCLRHHGRLLQADTRRSTSSRDVGGQTGDYTDARGCRGQESDGGRVGATNHPHERVQKGCPGSTPSQPRIGSRGHSEAVQWHRLRRARAQSATLLLAALSRWSIKTIEAALLAPWERPETTPRPRMASASRRAAAESAHGRPEQSRCLVRLALGAATGPLQRWRGPPRTLGIC